MVAVAALAVVPAGQVDTSGFAVTLDKAIRTLVDIWRDEERDMNRVHIAVKNVPYSDTGFRVPFPPGTHLHHRLLLIDKNTRSF